MLRSVSALAAALGLVATACGGDVTPGPDLSSLSWSDCGRLECAELQVPLDHDDPDGETITIELNRSRVEDGEKRIGVLLVNPGGPGGSGTVMAEFFSDRHPDLAEVFDIVGWDPRGVAGSSELNCDAPLRSFYELDNAPDDEAEVAALEAAAIAAAEACSEADRFLPHVGSGDVVEDMDLIRQALGEERISFYGASYGSVLGLGYATRYGSNLRALVVDGVTDPDHTMREWLTSQSIAVEAALGEILGDLQPLQDALDAADADPAGSPSDVARAAISATYDPGAADRLASALSDARFGDDASVRQLSDQYLGSAGFDVYTAVKCLDVEQPADVAGFSQMADQVATRAPVIGAAIANELLPCGAWPVQPEVPFPVLDDTAAPPFLILGNTGDAATPYADAVAVAGRLTNATLLTHDGTGHLSFGRSDCVNAVVIAYFIDLVVPPPTVAC
ncbi:MAG: alpha/beta hydrolase [Actinomycetota bacterium]